MAALHRQTRHPPFYMQSVRVSMSTAAELDLLKFAMGQLFEHLHSAVIRATFVMKVGESGSSECSQAITRRTEESLSTNQIPSIGVYTGLLYSTFQVQQTFDVYALPTVKRVFLILHEQRLCIILFHYTVMIESLRCVITLMAEENIDNAEDFH